MLTLELPFTKKDTKNNVENYRPVASLCSTSKIFERLILNKISKLEKLNEINLVGKQQHGYIPLTCINTTLDTLKVRCKKFFF